MWFAVHFFLNWWDISDLVPFLNPVRKNLSQKLKMNILSVEKIFKKSEIYFCIRFRTLLFFAT